MKVKNQKCPSNEDQEKCTKQHAEIVAMSVKYHLSQEIQDQFTVQIVLKIIKEINLIIENIIRTKLFIPTNQYLVCHCLTQQSNA